MNVLPVDNILLISLFRDKGDRAYLVTEILNNFFRLYAQSVNIRHLRSDSKNGVFIIKNNEDFQFFDELKTFGDIKNYEEIPDISKVIAHCCPYDVSHEDFEKFVFKFYVLQFPLHKKVKFTERRIVKAAQEWSHYYECFRFISLVNSKSYDFDLFNSTVYKVFNGFKTWSIFKDFSYAMRDKKKLRTICQLMKYLGVYYA